MIFSDFESRYFIKLSKILTRKHIGRLYYLSLFQFRRFFFDRYVNFHVNPAQCSLVIITMVKYGIPGQKPSYGAHSLPYKQHGSTLFTGLTSQRASLKYRIKQTPRVEKVTPFGRLKLFDTITGSAFLIKPSSSRVIALLGNGRRLHLHQD